jgi:hypothetical protein
MKNLIPKIKHTKKQITLPIKKKEANYNQKPPQQVTTKIFAPF